MTTAAYEIKTDALGTSSNSRRFRTWTFTGEQIARYREFGDCVYTDEQERSENLAYNARFTDQQMAERMAVDSHLKVTGWNCTIVESTREMVAMTRWFVNRMRATGHLLSVTSEPQENAWTESVEVVPAEAYREAVGALVRVAAGPNDKPYSEPWSMAEAKIALDRLGLEAHHHA